MNLHMGIDVGSTTVKVVVIEPETKNLLFARYARHNACQIETVFTLLSEVFATFPEAVLYAAVCGSGGLPIAELLNTVYIQEVVANALAIRTFYPTTQVAIELGGQDAKIIFFYRDESTGKLTTSDMRMNGSCAGGTGAFIDEIAALLQIPVEDFESFAAQGNFVYEISGRCGVFAKTDIQPLLNQGCRREDIALSAFHAIVKQTIGGLAQGLELKAPIVFEGGPLTFNPTLARVFSEWLSLSAEDSIRPQNPETIVAHGAAISVQEVFADQVKQLMPEQALAALASYRHSVNTADTAAQRFYFSTHEERTAFEERHRLPPEPAYPLKAGSTVSAYLGIDSGSTTSKFVLLDEEEQVIDSFYAGNKGEPLLVIKQALLDLKKKYDDAGVALEIKALGTTGYGELLFDRAFGADYHTVETVAHAQAAQKYVPDLSFILDIGGQDMKAITIAGGIVTNITVNEACSAGCGSFLENFAATLNIPVEKIAETAFNAKNPAELGSRCTVFMNSTIITEQKNGKQADDIMAGLCRSIIENVFTKVVRIANFATLGDNIVVQGGTFRNDAVLRAFEQYIDKPVIRAPYPGLMGAIGIALLTKRAIAEQGAAFQSRFIGLDALRDFSYTQKSNIKCTFCANNCVRTLLSFSNGTQWVTGNRCERGEIIGDPKDKALYEKVNKINAAIEAVPDMIKIREKLLFQDYPFTPVYPEQNITIGIPRVLDFWRNMPFWTTFFHALGFKTKISKPSSRKLFEQGLQFVTSDTVCFPAKLVHGHIQDLAKNENVDRIFMPLLNQIPSENREENSVFTCPVLKGYGLVVKNSDNPQRRWKVPLDTPMFHWFSQKDRDNQLCRYMQDTFGIPERSVRKALIQADLAQDTFTEELVTEGVRIISEVEDNGAFAVVITGRHYQFDQVVNHNLSRYFTALGIPVLTVDALPGVQDVDLSQSMLDINNNNHARLLSGAILTAQHPSLEYVEIFSFGCGHDALYTDEVIRIMQEIAGKSPLILKLDESDVTGPLRIRVRSFVETVKARRKLDTGAVAVKELGDPYLVNFTEHDKKLKTILVPNVTHSFCKILSAALRRDGLKAEPLPMGSKEAMQLGKKYVHNDICFPAQMMIGEALAALQSGKYDPEQVAVGSGKTFCDCRLTNYMVLTRKALDDAGFPNVPIISSDFLDLKNIHPAFKFSKLTYARVAWCLVMADMLADLCRKIRPYELNPGETNRVFDESVDEITDTFCRKGMKGAFDAYRKAIDAVCEIPYNRTKRKPLVFVTGEYLLTFHEGSNFYIEEYLEHNNMEVELPRMYDVYRNILLLHTVSEIKDFHVRHSMPDTLYAFGGDKYFDITINIMEKIAQKHPLYEPCLRLTEAAKISDHIIHHSIQSGEGFLMVADIMHRAAQGVKSFIILQPFGCLPNHVCGRGLIKRIKEDYPDIQILPLDYDPDTSFANIENRLQMLIMNARNLDSTPPPAIPNEYTEDDLFIDPLDSINADDGTGIMAKLHLNELANVKEAVKKLFSA
jgi:predicted CoA-substrate-specific enzyme activase